MGKITDYAAVTTLAAANVFLIDGANGTKTITAQNVSKSLAALLPNDDLFAMLDNIAAPEVHRMIFRGKSLGSSFTAAQKAEVQAGTFKGLWLGDYWTINNVVYRIVDFNYWKRCGDTDFDTNHLVIMPDSPLYNAKMNETNTTEGGYVGSKMYTENLDAAKTTITTAFGASVLTHREYLVNAVTNGKPSGGAWFDSTVELPNEIMIYGCHVFMPANDGVTIPTRYTINNSQLALMQAAPRFIKNRAHYWLRDAVSAADFALVNGSGGAYGTGASRSFGVRPVFAVG